MIAHLRGRLLEKQPNRLIVDVQGVGYELQVPLSTFYETADPGTEVALRVHTHVREDQISLFAFATSLEQALFERLITVSGVGPKLALAALSGIEPADLVRAICAADIARLTRIPGIGRKTAERISLELKDKVLGTRRDHRRNAPGTSGASRCRSRRRLGAGESRLSTDRCRESGGVGARERWQRGAVRPPVAPCVEGAVALTRRR